MRPESLSPELAEKPFGMIVRDDAHRFPSLEPER
jgi:hypothetical protein